MPEHQAVASQEYWLPWLSEAGRRDFELKEGRFLNLMAKYKSQKKGRLADWPTIK
jgi:hypothetical protein